LHQNFFGLPDRSKNLPGKHRFADLITCVALLRKEWNQSQFSGDLEDL
jgi:hypothetical protein